MPEATTRTDDRLLLSLRDLETILNADERTLRRRADDGTMPPGVKIGSLRRWPRAEILAWIEQGCPRVRPLTAKGGASR